jgi:hypothetical protein
MILVSLLRAQYILQVKNILFEFGSCFFVEFSFKFEFFDHYLSILWIFPSV